MADTNKNESPYWVGDSFVEPGLNQITTADQTHKVERQVLKVLAYLVEHSEEPVTRDAIIRHVWADAVPNDEGLTQAISKLRKALGDRPSEGNVIQTIPKVGYRLVAPIGMTRLPPLGFEMPISVRSFTRGSPAGRSVRVRVHGNWLAAAALLSVTIFFLSLTF